MPIEKSAGAIVFRKENREIFYLLLQKEMGQWDFSRGWIEKGESLQDTARREIKEETGISDLEFLPDFKETIKFFFKFQGKTILKFITYFLAETKQKEVKVSYEHKAFQWLAFEKAMEHLSYKDSKEVLVKANEYLVKREA